MSCCKRCRSYAINHHRHGRDGTDEDLCDVCFWRQRAETAAAALADEPLGLTSTEGLGPGEPALDEDGDVSLDWAVNGMMLTMSVSKTGSIAYAWLTPGCVEPSGHGTMHSHPALHEILSAAAGMDSMA